MREQKCGICWSEKIETTYNVGYDIDESGEENQHLAKCMDCGADCLWANRLQWDGKIRSFRSITWWGKWRKKS